MSAIYAALADLAALEHKAKGFSFLPRQPVHSLLTGRRASRMRGRGLNFEEIRGYLPGDDVRSIDWRVTARVGKPHVRVFTEERDRPAIIAVDQRLSMFFGSRVAMKSVVAAEAAALAAWRVVKVGDRVGALVFNDTDVVEIRPHRSRPTVMRIIGAIVGQNHALRADSPVTPNPGMLNRVLEELSRMASHDYLITIISDFDGADQETRRLVSRLVRHNDVIAVPVTDPLSAELPSRGRLVMGDGALQVEVDVARAPVRTKLLEITGGRLQRVLAWQDELGVGVLPLTTTEGAAEQVRRRLGGLTRRV